MTFRNPLARLAVLVALLGPAALPAAAHAVGFSNPTNYAVPDPSDSHGLQDVVVGDFNGDSRPDLATVHEDQDKVSILVGTAAGTFTGPTHYTLFSHANPLSIAAADFNGDSDLDLAVADEGSSTDPQSTVGGVSVLLGGSNASFGSLAYYSTGTPGNGVRPQAIAIGNFNADSDPDLAVATLGPSGSPGDVAVLLGDPSDGDGSFGTATNHVTAINPRGVGVGDFDGDGDRDIAVANAESNNVSILLGNGSGGFGALPNVPAGVTPHALEVGDFNGDSDPDLVVANETAHTVSVLVGSGSTSATFVTPAPSYATNNLPDAIAIGEFSGDSDPDLAVATQGHTFGVDKVTVLVGQAGGAGFGGRVDFDVGQDPTVGEDPTSVAVGDFNADSYHDLAITTGISSVVSILSGARPYSRPTGGTPFRVPLVPAFEECSTPDSTHGGGLPLNQSCKDSALSSTTVRLGSSVFPGTRVGYARVDVCQTNTAPGCTGLTASQVPDVRLRGNGSDVVCAAGAPAAACPAGPGSDYDPNSGASPYLWGLANPGGPTGCSPGPCSPNSNKDFPSTTSTPGSDAACDPSPPNPSACAAGADMTAIAAIPDSANTAGRSIRVTDSFNDTRSNADSPDCVSTTSCSATVRDQSFPIPVVCEANSDVTVGSYCGVNTTANALFPGVVATGKAAIVEIGHIQVYDSGPDGTRGNSDDQLFATQGILIP